MRQVPILRANPLFNIFSVVMLSEFNANMLLPILTFIFFAHDSALFLSPLTQVKRGVLFGLCIALGKMAALFANGVVNSITDYHGRKIGLFLSQCSILIFAVTALFAFYLHSVVIFISGFVLFNLFYIAKPVGLTIVGDRSNDENRVAIMSALQCVISIGACFGPILGGYLATQSLFNNVAYSTPFIMAIVIVVLVLCCIRYCQESFVTHSAKHSHLSVLHLLKSYFSLLKQTNVQQLFCVLILSQLTWGSYYEFSGPIAKLLFHFSTAQVGLFVGMIAFWLILATAVIIPLLTRYLRHSSIVFSALILLIMGIALTIIASYFPGHILGRYLFFAGAAPTAIGDVMLYSLFVSYLSRSVAKDQQAKIMGLSYVMITLVWSLTGLLGGYLIGILPHALLFFMLCGVSVLLLVLLCCRPMRLIFEL